VAFSGGVDSSFLLAAAVAAVGKKKVLAILGESPLRPERELVKARRTAAGLDVKLHRLATGEMAIKEFLRNPPERCYICKRHLLSRAGAAAVQWHAESVLVEGSNRDDLHDYRPGLKAVRELGVASPLLELGFSKQEIRAFSRKLGLDTWNQPAFSCLATRIPYASPITEARLERIDRAETILMEFGFNPVRVRDYRDLCRIEIDRQKLSLLLDEKIRGPLLSRLKESGYRYVTLDLEGLRRCSPATATATASPDQEPRN